MQALYLTEFGSSAVLQYGVWRGVFAVTAI